MHRICVQWPRFGPYHLARLRATHRYFEERGVEVVGLETAGDDATYAWDVERGAEPFRREQVFPGRTFESIPPREMDDGVTAALDRLDPDGVAIVSYSHPDARACLGWCRRNRRTAVLMTATKEDDAERVGWRERVKALLVGLFDAALVGGSPQRAYLERLGFPKDRIFQPYNAVDNAFFAERADAARRNGAARPALPGLDHPPPFFLASNRFLPRKNLDGLLRAYASYHRATDAPWPLLLLGDGPERARLERLVREEQIGDVMFCGFQQRDALPAYYGAAGAFVHPTHQDQWALVVNEAMASGLPVLVSERAGCARDLVRDGENGFTFDPADEAALARLLAHISAPDTDRVALGVRSREIVRGWSPEAFAEGLWDAFQAGAPHADRGLGPVAAGVLWALRTAARDARAFHSVAD